jgi:NAD(P)-dependent dehydrogenase (short-subunit alcohol dehydrogenase family)
MDEMTREISQTAATETVRALQGQRVVVVGGTSGMGLGAVNAALKAGAEIVVAGRRPKDSRPLASDSYSVTHAIVDVHEEAAVRTLFEDIGELNHLLVTATPPAVAATFLTQDTGAAQQFMNGKFFGSWICARYAAPKIRPGGSITFLTGCASVRPRSGSAAVTATFAALEALSRALALELGPIRVNTIRPGLIESEMWNVLDAAARDELRRKTRETLPVHRIGATEDIGHAAVFLMTNPYVTGALLEVSGGETLVSLDL